MLQGYAQIAGREPAGGMIVSILIANMIPRKGNSVKESERISPGHGGPSLHTLLRQLEEQPHQTSFGDDGRDMNIRLGHAQRPARPSATAPHGLLFVTVWAVFTEEKLPAQPQLML